MISLEIKQSESAIPKIWNGKNENESKNEDFSEISQNEKASKRIIQHEEQEAKNEIKEDESSAVKKRKENELNELDKMLNDFNAD